MRTSNYTQNRFLRVYLQAFNRELGNKLNDVSIVIYHHQLTQLIVCLQTSQQTAKLVVIIGLA